jgi:hypothetical protein
MSNKNKSIVQESGEVTAQVSNIEVQSFDESIRSSAKKGGKPLSDGVKSVFEKMQNAIDFAQKGNGKSQINFPHSEFPITNKKLNSTINNALLRGKKQFSNVKFNVVIDAMNKDGVRLNASVLRVIIEEKNI